MELKINLPNFHKVSGSLSRCGQPTKNGFLDLRAKGFKGIANLRYDRSDELDILNLGFSYIQIPFHEWHPEREDAEKFLGFMKNPENLPAIVHCIYGADRTGVMVALYRITVQGWETDRAVDEMFNGGFGAHLIWKPFLKPFLEKYKPLPGTPAKP